MDPNLDPGGPKPCGAGSPTLSDIIPFKRYVLEDQLVTCRVGLKECQEQLTRLFGQNLVLMSRLDSTPDTVSISGLKCTATVSFQLVTAKIS